MKKYDHTSEGELIYYMIDKGKCLPLEAEDFGNFNYQEIFKVIKKLADNKVTINSKSVIESLSGNRELVKLTSELIMSGLPVKNVDIRISSIKEHRIKRTLYNKVILLQEMVDDPTLAGCYIAEQGIEIFKKIAKLSGGTRNLTQEVRDLLAVTSGNITTTICHNLLQTVTSSEKKKINTIMHRLEKEGLIEKTHRVVGEYRVKDQQLDKIDWRDTDAKEMRFDWPLGIGQHFRLMPKNIVTVSGETDAGKTALALNIAALNAERYAGKINYYSSEMGNIELRSRLEEFAKLEPPANVPLELWDKVNFYERVQNFHDVIEPNAINIVDYLELHEDFYKVGGYIKSIFDQLESGVAIILIQKKEGAKYAYGAELSVQKARLAINLDNDYPHHRAILNKVKNWRNVKHNPNGLEIKYSLLRGAYFNTKGGWYRPSAEEVEERKKKGAKKQWQTK